MNVRKGILLTVILSIACLNIQAQNRPVHEIYSMMVYNFMKYVEWPPSSKSGDFVIAVVGDQQVYETMSKWYGNKNKGAQKITIKNVKSLSELDGCHVLFLGANKSGNFDAIKSKLSSKSVLLITNKNGLGKKGSCINFKVINGKLKFELNQNAMKVHDLKVSGQLANMAILI